jgi:hypothetical protein
MENLTQISKKRRTPPHHSGSHSYDDKQLYSAKRLRLSYNEDTFSINGLSDAMSNSYLVDTEVIINQPNQNLNAANAENHLTLTTSLEVVEEVVYDVSEDLSDDYEISPNAVSELIIENSFESKKSQQIFIRTEFSNELFLITSLVTSGQQSTDLELSLSPPTDSQGNQVAGEGFVECPINFRMKIRGVWSSKLHAEKDDLIRVIGTFSK